jgi:hypothetical protein
MKSRTVLLSHTPSSIYCITVIQVFLPVRRMQLVSFSLLSLHLIIVKYFRGSDLGFFSMAVAMFKICNWSINSFAVDYFLLSANESRRTMLRHCIFIRI